MLECHKHLGIAFSVNACLGRGGRRLMSGIRSLPKEKNTCSFPPHPPVMTTSQNSPPYHGAQTIVVVIIVYFEAVQIPFATDVLVVIAGPLLNGNISEVHV